MTPRPPASPLRARPFPVLLALPASPPGGAGGGPGGTRAPLRPGRAPTCRARSLGEAPPTPQPGGSSPLTPRQTRPQRCRLARSPPPLAASLPLRRTLAAARPPLPPPSAKFPVCALAPPHQSRLVPPSSADALRGRPSDPSVPGSGRVQAAPPPPPHRRPLPADGGSAAGAPGSRSRPRRTCGPGLRRARVWSPPPTSFASTGWGGAERVVPAPNRVQRPGGPGATCPMRTWPLGPAPKVHSVAAPRPVPCRAGSPSSCPRLCLGCFLFSLASLPPRVSAPAIPGSLRLSPFFFPRSLCSFSPGLSVLSPWVILFPVLSLSVLSP